MSRLARRNLCTSFFHVIVQGVNREFIFEKYKYREKYFHLLEEVKKDHILDILAYSIMYNHTHMLVHTEKIKELSDFMKKVNEKYAKYYNYMENRVGHVFRDRYMSEPITNKKYLINCLAYIHNNPVKANIVKKCEDYQFSSYLDYINENKFVNKDIIKLVFDTNKLDLSLYKELHLGKRYYFSDYNNATEENVQEILQEIERMYGQNIENLLKKEHLVYKIVLEIKERIPNISNLQISKTLGINKNIIYKILK